MGERIRALRRRRLMTQQELAAAAGIPRWKTIQEIESGKSGGRLSTLRKIAAALGVPPEELAPEDPHPAA